MAKSRSSYVCNQCGSESFQYFGKCPNCGEWNCLVEQVPTGAVSPINPSATSKAFRQRWQEDRYSNHPPQPKASIPLAAITDHPQSRFSSGYVELDRVLGGGIVPGSLVLVGGDPGIGKSTLLLQVATQLATHQPVLYVCAEESGQQVKLRWQRLIDGQTQVADPNQVSAQLVQGTAVCPSLNPDPSPSLYLLPETDLETILLELQSLRPPVAVIDSIQALFFAPLNSAPGSVAQVRECTSLLMQLAKRETIALFIVGHVTKEGAIAGPKVLEHLVDTVLYFEGDRFASHRLLRSVKNRFGATHEIGVFEMVSRGLAEVSNPSQLFLGNGEEPTSGTATIVACEGSRPLVVELQALISPTSYSSPRRSTTGIEYGRLLQILAVLEKRVGIPLSKLDAYVAAAAGLNVGEPAADLGVAMAVVASFRDRIVNPRTVLIGEVGLGGQVRPVSQMELRLKEAAKLGFQQAIVPKGQEMNGIGMDVIAVSRVVDAMGAAFMTNG